MKKIIFIIIILALIIGIMAYLNKPDTNIDVSISLKNNGDEVADITLEDLEKLNVVDFDAVLKSSGKAPIDKKYTGVLMKDLLKKYNIQIDGNSQVNVKAIDGYVVAYPGEKVLDDENIYIAFKEDGEFMKGKEGGGRGPFLAVVSKDKFSQYWCKYLVEIDVQ